MPCLRSSLEESAGRAVCRRAPCQGRDDPRGSKLVIPLGARHDEPAVLETLCTTKLHNGRERRLDLIGRRGVRFLEVALYVDGARRGGTRIGAEAVPIVAAALDAVVWNRKEPIGTFVDGRMTIEVSVEATRLEHVVNAIVLRRFDAAGQQAGAPVALHGTQELDALARGLELLLTE
jgi:hypothetical protein